MKATTKLHVNPSMQVSISLEMTVEEMDALLEATKDVHRWPTDRLRRCLLQALSAARGAYSSEHVLD